MGCGTPELPVIMCKVIREFAATFQGTSGAPHTPPNPAESNTLPSLLNVRWVVLNKGLLSRTGVFTPGPCVCISLLS